MGKSSAIRYDPSYCRRLSAYAINNETFAATNKEIAAVLGCCERTVTEWCKVHPEFKDTIDELKITPNINVERAIYKNAIGHHVDEVVKDFNGAGELVHIRAVHKYIPPNAASQSLWARNRMADRYKNATEITILKDERADAELAAILAEADAAEQGAGNTDT